MAISDFFGTSKPAPNEAARRERLAELTLTAKRGLVAFAETGHALAAIQAEELWRLKSATWTKWCSEELGLTERRVGQLVEAAATCQSLVAAGLKMPSSERVARELAGIPAQAAVEVWQEATATAGDKAPTAELVAKVARKRKVKKNRKAVARPVTFNKIPGATVKVIPRRNGFTSVEAALLHALDMARKASGDQREAA